MDTCLKIILNKISKYKDSQSTTKNILVKGNCEVEFSKFL